MKKNTNLWLAALVVAVLIPATLIAVQVLGYQDLQIISAPGNPPSGFLRFSAQTGALGCKTSAGANCLTGLAPGGTAGGDLSGTYPNPAVAGLVSVPFCSGYTPTNGQFVQYTTGGSPNPCYAAAGGTGFANPMTTKGDVIVGGTSGTPARLGVGSNTQCLTANSAATNGVDWEACGGGGGGGGLTQISQCLPSAAATCAFTSIPGTYTNLILEWSARTAGTGGNQYQDTLQMTVNADGGSNYNFIYQTFNGSVGGGSGTLTYMLMGWACGGGCAAGAQGSGTIRIPGYATAFRKTLSTISAMGFTNSLLSNEIGFTSFTDWNNTAAITSLSITTASGTNFTTSPQTVFTLYGEQ